MRDPVGGGCVPQAFPYHLGGHVTVRALHVLVVHVELKKPHAAATGMLCAGF